MSEIWNIPITEPEDLREYFKNERIAREKDRFNSSEWLQKQ